MSGIGLIEAGYQQIGQFSTGGGGGGNPATVATFADLSTISPTDGEYVVVTDAIPYAESVVRWSNKDSNWKLLVSQYTGAAPSTNEIYNSGGIIVVVITGSGLIDSVNSAGYYWDGAAWVTLT